MKTNVKSKSGIRIHHLISKSFLGILSFAFAGIALNAQNLNDSVAENKSQNETTWAMADNTVAISFKPNSVILFETNAASETEKALQIEDWMMDETHFSSVYRIETTKETPLVLENWMTNSSVFGLNTTFLEVETEESLQLENWMKDENTFSNPSFQFSEDKENALELENWMLNEDFFANVSGIEKPLKIQNWMISELIWK
jgi:hypothetical protein